MVEHLATLMDMVGSSVLVWFGIFVRVAAVVFLMPGIGERAIPARVKLGGALALSIVVTPMVISEIADVSPTAVDIGRIVMTEALAGLLIGIALRLMIHIIQLAGTIIAQSFSVSQMFGGLSGTDPEPIIASFLTMAVIALALVTGLHIKVILALQASYSIAPFGLALDPSSVGVWAAASGNAVFDIAIGLSLPFIILSFVYNLALGAINRAMPQLMVAFVGAPAITWMGIGLLLLAAPVILNTWLDHLDTVLANPFEAIR